MRPFHEHYIPSNDILSYAMRQLEQHPIEMILPQHGSIIPNHLVDYMINSLKNLDCGLFLMTSDQTDIRRLSLLNQTLKDITRAMIITRDFRDIATELLKIARRLLPANSIEFYSNSEDGGILFFSPDNRFRGNTSILPAAIAEIININQNDWKIDQRNRYKQLVLSNKAGNEDPCILIPLFSAETGKIHGAAIIRLSESVIPSRDLSQLIESMALPLDIALERETIYRTLDLERQQVYERSIRDPLTGLYTRHYMRETIQRLQAIHDRDKEASLALAMIDIDHVKNINDTYGHNQGDIILQKAAKSIKKTTRKGDLPIRFGGEEFAVFVVGKSALNIENFAELMRKNIADMSFAPPLSEVKITISIGVATRQQHEELTNFIERADKALYQAKENGRNRVCKADDPE